VIEKRVSNAEKVFFGEWVRGINNLNEELSMKKRIGGGCYNNTTSVPRRMAQVRGNHVDAMWK
jgi:hypothetical protein